MKIVTLTPEQFDRFASKHRYRNFYQSSAYARSMLRFGYSIHYLGLTDNHNSLIGATFIAYKEVFMNNKIAYAPRGILFDYIDSSQVRKMVEKLKKTLGKQGFMLLRMDPYIPISIRSNTGDIININNQESTILENLATAGFEYKGKNLYFEYEKPRWEALVLLNKSTEDIFENFNIKTKNKIKKAQSIGITIYKDPEQSLEKLYEFTRKKDKKPLSYYQELCKTFKENIEVYYAKINAGTFVVNSRKMYEQEIQNNEQLAEQIREYDINDKERANILDKKMASDKLITIYKNNIIAATDLIKNHPKGIILGGAIVINYDNAAFILADGIDEKYISLNASYLIKWEIINNASNRGFKYVNLGGIAGDFNENNTYKELNEAKLGFNPVVSEYIGEFDVILNNFAYNLYKSFNKNK